jgi:imidazolonepropionase-like amidohydrolase
MKTLAPTLALLVVATGVAAAETVAIEHATVHAEPGKKLEDATVVIQDGAIASVGEDVAVPRARGGSTRRGRSSPPA